MNQLIAHEIFGVVGEIKECCDIPMPSTTAAVCAFWATIDLAVLCGLI